MISRGTRRRIGTSYSIQTTRGVSHGGKPDAPGASQTGAATDGFTSTGAGSRSGGAGGFSCLSPGRAVRASATLDNIQCFITFLLSGTNGGLRGGAVRIAAKRYPTRPAWQERRVEFFGIVAATCQTVRNVTDSSTGLLHRRGCPQSSCITTRQERGARLESAFSRPK